MKTYSSPFKSLRRHWAICILAIIIISDYKPLSAEDRLQLQLSESDWVYVVVMLEHSNWPNNVKEQKIRSRTIQDQALGGPLRLGFKLVHRFETVPALAGWINQSGYQEVQHAFASRDKNIIRRIDPDVSGTVPSLSDAGSGGLLDSVPLINADKVHQLGVTGKNIEIAILDSGIDSDHPDLSDSLIAEQCFCFNPAGGCCPNGKKIQSGTGSGEDDHGHGTHIAGIVASSGAIASAGVAPDSDITMIKMLDSRGRFYSSSDIVAALDWLNANRPNLHVVNLSLQTDATFSDVCDNSYSWTQALFAAVQNLIVKDVLIVSIAGNSGAAGIITAPGCLSNVIAVGAADKNDVPASFSNSHSEVDYFAPGVDIVSDMLGGGTESRSGTSMACPHVVAVGALARQVSPDTSRRDLIQLFSSSGISITDSNGLTRPRIDAYDIVCTLQDCRSSGAAIPGIITLLLGN